jgi:protein TonB
MFDLVTGKSAHIPNRPTGPIVVASIIEAIVLLLVIVVPVLFVTGAVPEVPTMMAFVAAAPAPPPPPPPPAAPAQAAKAPATKTTAVSADAAPVEAPRTIEPETVVAAADQGTTGGVEGGVPSGVPGGTIGGVIGEVAPPPPPPPAPVAPRGPVRIGGQLQAPALLKRVEPIYPPLAVRAHMTGVVVLEATVDGDGKVVEAAVLRSAGPLLDREALIAVKQWRYSPLLLNGRRESFILTVTLSFNVAQPTG